jgi:hypothetical protein
MSKFIKFVIAIVALLTIYGVVHSATHQKEELIGDSNCHDDDESPMFVGS